MSCRRASKPIRPESSLERARNRYVAAWRNLAAVVGAATWRPGRLAGDVQDGLAPAHLGRHVRSAAGHESPQLASAQAGVARAQAALSRECAGRVPNVDLQAAVQYDNATGTRSPAFKSGFPSRSTTATRGTSAGRRRSCSRPSTKCKGSSWHCSSDLAAVFEQYTNARYQVEKYSRDILPNAEESLKLTTSGYQQGEFSYLSLLTAQRTFFQTNLTYLDALRELRAAATAIEGNLLSDSLRPEDTEERSGRQSGELDARGP